MTQVKLKINPIPIFQFPHTHTLLEETGPGTRPEGGEWRTLTNHRPRKPRERKRENARKSNAGHCNDSRGTGRPGQF